MNNSSKIIFPRNIENYIKKNTPGIDKMLEHRWVIWIQKKSNNWKQDNLVEYYNFNTVAGFWILMNNITLRPNNKYTFMKEGICPIWEDDMHIDGGYSTINIQKSGYYNIFLNLLLGLIGRTLTVPGFDIDKITGITYFDVSNTYKQIKFWITDKANELKLNNLNNDFYDIVKSNIYKTDDFIFFYFKSDKKKDNKKKNNNYFDNGE